MHYLDPRAPKPSMPTKENPTTRNVKRIRCSRTANDHKVGIRESIFEAPFDQRKYFWFLFAKRPSIVGVYDPTMAKQRSKKGTSEVTRVVAYIRVSTEQQAVDGSSLDAQRAQLEAYAKAFGYEIVAWEVDAGVSASSLDRPALQAAIACLESGSAEGLLVTKLDRLTRRLRDMANLVDRYFKDRFRLLSVNEHIDTGSAAGRMMLNILTSVAEWEREAAAERTAMVMANMKAQGKFTGGWPPFGWKQDEDGSLIEDPIEQHKMRTVRDAKSRGFSLRQIAALLGPNPNTGKPYSASQISRML